MADIEKGDYNYEGEDEDGVLGQSVQRRRASDNWEKVLIFIWISAILFWHFICSSDTSLRPQLRHITDQRPANSIPSYVIDYAPLVYLDEGETFYPSDLTTHLINTRPFTNRSLLASAPSPLTLDTLSLLNECSSSVFLTSANDPATSPPPSYLLGTKPSSTGKTPNAISTVVIVVDHEDGINTVDAFYFYFYSYNRGPRFLSHILGDHVGDWEHTMLRFTNEIPSSIWYSQHGSGSAYSYSAVEKFVHHDDSTRNGRPISYSARGTHANYPTAGTHPLTHLLPVPGSPTLPRKFLADYTSAGALWDPVRNAYWYTYNATTDAFSSASGAGTGIRDSPVGFLEFEGRWGDQAFEDADERQETFWGLKRFVDGPTGPRDKALSRVRVCPDGEVWCRVRGSLAMLDEEEEGGGEGLEREWEGEGTERKQERLGGRADDE